MALYIFFNKIRNLPTHGKLFLLIPRNPLTQRVKLDYI